jgi:hypothetical protein
MSYQYQVCIFLRLCDISFLVSILFRFAKVAYIFHLDLQNLLILTVLISGKSLQSVRLELAKEAEKKAMKEMHAESNEQDVELGDVDDDVDDLPNQDMTPGEFVFFGLEIEQQQ